MIRETRLINIQGIPMMVYAPPECISDDIVKYKNFWEFEIFNKWKHRFPTEGLMLDLGANIGSHCLQFNLNFPLLDIWAFEPHPQNFNLLLQNTKGNPRIICFNVGVGSTTSLVGIDDGHHSNAGVVRIVNNGKHIVLVLALDTLSFLNKRVTFVKLDVEGHEYSAIEGMRNMLEEHKPMIWVEDLLPGRPSVKFLNRLGYIVIEEMDKTNDFLLKHE